MGMGAFAPRGGAPAAASESPSAHTSALAAGPFSCQQDINCEEGAPYQDVKRAAAEGYDGQYICSGQLINNARQDNRYLYITAEHCEWWIDPPTMAYYWNYENSTCGSNDAPLRFSTGSTDLYHSAAADLDLLELDGTDLEGLYDIYFVGWNRSGDTAHISRHDRIPIRQTQADLDPQRPGHRLRDRRVFERLGAELLENRLI